MNDNDPIQELLANVGGGYTLEGELASSQPSLFEMKRQRGIASYFAPSVKRAVTDSVGEPDGVDSDAG